MAVERLLDRIHKEALEEADRIESASSENVNQIIEEAKQQIKEKISLLEEDNRLEIEKVHLFTTTKANLEGKKQLLYKKRECVESLFGELADLVKKDKRFDDFFNKRIKDACSKNTDHILISEDLFHLKNQILDSVETDIDIKIEKNLTTTVVVCEGKRKKIISFDDMLGILKSKVISQISAKLFS